MSNLKQDPALDDEITALVARLIETQLQLQGLAGGELDAVLLPGGQSYLLLEAQEKLRQSEVDLRESAAIQSAILDALTGRIALLDQCGVIVAVNEAWSNFVAAPGVPDSGAGAGADYIQICEQAREAGFLFDGDAAAGIRAVLTGAADAFALDYACPTEDGDLWFRMRVNPVRGDESFGAVVLHVDITESQRAVAALRQREAEFRTLAEAVPQIVWMTQADGLNIYFNQRWMDYTGLKLEEGLGHGWAKPFHPEDRARARDSWAQAMAAAEPHELEARIRRADGVYRWWLIRAVPHVDESGVLTKWFGTCTDIHDLKVATDALRYALDETERQVTDRTRELAAANARLSAAVKHADAANLAKSQFLSRMSHELRTPLNAVLGYGQLLHRRYQDPEIKEFAGAILSGGRHLLQLIDEVLDIGRVESGDLSVSLEPVDYNEVLAHTMTIIQPLADAAGIDVKAESGTCGGLWLRADRQRLIQVLINLLGNAVKYNRKGGHVSVSCVCVPDATCRIEVSDTGVGIAPSDQAQLFQPFQRFGDLGIEGTGLGLALSQRLVSLMGGRLGLAASSERGSTFFVELKTAEAAPANPAPPSQIVENELNDDLRGEILCVEDNPSNMRLIELFVARWKGVSLIPAMNGTTAIEVARTRVPSLILLDLHLPDMDGDTVLHCLKQDPTTAGIPIVVVSADATSEQVKALLLAGVVTYLTKPLDLSIFAEVLRRFLTQKKSS